MEVNQESRETAEHSLRREEQVASGQLSQTNAEPRRRKAVARPSSTFTVDDSQTVKESSWQPWTATRRFWQSEVSIVVDRKCSRDHLALERTFLAYLRTSLMLCNVGVIVTELFAIERSESRLGLLYVAKPFAATCYTAAIVTVFLGAVRTWRYQKAMVNGRAISGGFEVTILGILFVLMFMIFCALIIVINVLDDKEV